MLLRVSFEALASCFVLLLMVSELIYFDTHLACLSFRLPSRPLRLYLFTGFVSLVALSRQLADGSFRCSKVSISLQDYNGKLQIST